MMAAGKRAFCGRSSWLVYLALLLVCTEIVVALPMLAATSGSNFYPENGLFADGTFLRPTRLFSPFSPMTRFVSAKRKGVPFFAFGGKRDNSDNFFPTKSNVRARSYFAWGGKRSGPVEIHDAINPANNRGPRNAYHLSPASDFQMSYD